MTRLPDVLLVCAIMTSAFAGMLMALLLASQLANATRTSPWIRWWALAGGLWIGWVLVR